MTIKVTETFLDIYLYIYYILYRKMKGFESNVVILFLGLLRKVVGLLIAAVSTLLATASARYVMEVLWENCDRNLKLVEWLLTL